MRKTHTKLVYKTSKLVALLIVPVVIVSTILSHVALASDLQASDFTFKLRANTLVSPAIYLNNGDSDDNGDVYQYTGSEDKNEPPLYARIMTLKPTYLKNGRTSGESLTIDICFPSTTTWIYNKDGNPNDLGTADGAETWGVTIPPNAGWSTTLSNYLKDYPSNVSEVKKPYFKDLVKECKGKSKIDITPLVNRRIHTTLKSSDEFEDVWKSKIMTDANLANIAKKNFYVGLKKTGQTKWTRPPVQVPIADDGTIDFALPFKGIVITKGSYDLVVYQGRGNWGITKTYQDENSEIGVGDIIKGLGDGDLYDLWRRIVRDNVSVEDIFNEEQAAATRAQKLTDYRDLFYDASGNLKNADVQRFCFISAWDDNSDFDIPQPVFFVGKNTDGWIRNANDVLIQDLVSGKYVIVGSSPDTTGPVASATDYNGENVMQFIMRDPILGYDLGNAYGTLKGYYSCLKATDEFGDELTRIYDLEPPKLELVTTSDTATKQEKCPIPGVLGWILTPICEVAVDMTHTIGGVITDMLEVTRLETGDNTYKAWAAFRDLANAFLVIIFLIIIFAQILPIELDNYTVKKALPRFIAAAIAIQFSYLMSTILVDVFNVLGGGVASLFDLVKLTDVAKGTGSNFLTSGLTFLALGIGGALFIGPVMLLVVAAAVSVLTMFVTIVIREMTLVLLIIASPIAILAWILPNTETYFKKWWSMLLKLLLMYPLIQMILSGADLISTVMSSVADSTFEKILAAFIPVIAFFMVPATFKASGGIMGAVANAGFGRSRALAGRARASARESAMARAKESGGKLLAGEGRFGNKAYKRGLGRVLTGNTLSFGARGQRKVNSAIEDARGLLAKDADAVIKAKASTNPEKLKALQSGKLGGKKIDGATRQQLLRQLMENGGWKEYAEYFQSEDLPTKDGWIDYAEAGKKWGMSEDQAKQVWTRAHEGSTGAAAAKAGYSPQGNGGLLQGKASQAVGWRKERLDEHLQEMVDVKNYDRVTSLMSQIAGNRDLASSLDSMPLENLKKRVAEDASGLGEQKILFNGKQITFNEFFDPSNGHVVDNKIIGVD